MAPPLTVLNLCSERKSSAFSPTLLSGGEGGRRPDEGVVVGRLTPPNAPLIRLRHLLPPQKARGEKVAEGRMRGLWLDVLPHLTPPSSGFATFSPRKKRGGRRRSIGEGCDSNHRTSRRGEA